MKYYSEVLNKVFDTEDALIEAENVVAEEAKKKEELRAKREERAKEVEAAFAKVEEDRAAATELLEAFCEDYGTFHTSLKNASLLKNPLADLFNHWTLHM